MRLVALLFLIMAQTAYADPAALAAINAERADRGRAALTYNDQLESAARAHGLDMATKGYFSHTGSDGSKIGTRVNRAGYRWCFVGENIASGQRSLPEVMAGWMASTGHRRNILHRKARQVGLARVTGNSRVTGDYWVMVLAAPC